MHPPWYIYLPAIMTVSEGKRAILDRKLEIRFYTKGGKEKKPGLCDFNIMKYPL